jgi:predicted metal-dependent phosphoesterase TrpH
MRIDLHCHSSYSYDNYLDPLQVITRARELNLDGVCFTEHLSYDLSRFVESLDPPDGFLILRGVEISTDKGHVLVYGVRDDSWNTWHRDFHLEILEVVRNVQSLGGICVPAHPFRGWNALGEEIFQIEGFEALETHNGLSTDEQNQRALNAANRLRLPSIGGSDCHRIDVLGKTFTEFQARFQTMEEMIEEIKAGNCRGVYGDRMG